MTIKSKRFDIADHLDDEASIQEYFRQVLADGDSDEIVRVPLAYHLQSCNCILFIC